MKNNIWFTALAMTVAVAAVCVAGFIAVDRLVLHPQDKPAIAVSASNATPPAGGNTDGSAQDAADPDMIGLWSSEGASGEMVDPDTGFATGSVYNGEWYLFRGDGTFRYVIVAGQVLSGGVVWEGKYSVGDGEIKLTNIKESWYPNPAAAGQKEQYENKKVDNTVLEYEFGDDSGTLFINGDGFSRVKEN